MGKTELKEENAVLREDLARASADYFRVLSELVPYMRGEIAHLRQENAELKERLSGRSED